MNTLNDVPLSADEVHMICNAISTELITNKELTEEYRLELDVLYDRLQAIEEILS